MGSYVAKSLRLARRHPSAVDARTPCSPANRTTVALILAGPTGRYRMPSKGHFQGSGGAANARNRWQAHPERCDTAQE